MNGNFEYDINNNKLKDNLLEIDECLNVEIYVDTEKCIKMVRVLNSIIKSGAKNSSIFTKLLHQLTKSLKNCLIKGPYKLILETCITIETLAKYFGQSSLSSMYILIPQLLELMEQNETKKIALSTLKTIVMCVECADFFKYILPYLGHINIRVRVEASQCLLIMVMDYSTETTMRVYNELADATEACLTIESSGSEHVPTLRSNCRKMIMELKQKYDATIYPDDPVSMETVMAEHRLLKMNQLEKNNSKDSSIKRSKALTSLHQTQNQNFDESYETEFDQTDCDEINSVSQSYAKEEPFIENVHSQRNNACGDVNITTTADNKKNNTSDKRGIKNIYKNIRSYLASGNTKERR